MNERDSSLVSSQLEAKGYEATSSENDADIVLINSCSVRDQAEQKALGKMGLLLASARRGMRKRIHGFMGCMSQLRGSDILKVLPDVDLVIGTQQFHNTSGFLDALETAPLGTRIVQTGESLDAHRFVHIHPTHVPPVSAYVSIMQGCDMFCTFCIVPSTRGRERSRSIEEIVDEVSQLAQRGAREIVLLGQIVNLYGRHEIYRKNGISPFVQLLEAVHAVPGIERIRFTSPHPIGLRDDLIESYKKLPKLCEHIHLPVQSGNNAILKAMHRGYTREGYLRKIDALRSAVPNIAITTDIIVGFPGESDAHFLDTVSLVESVGFDNAFIFRYSVRSGTPAALVEDQIPEAVKEERNKKLLSLLDTRIRAKNNSLVGSKQEILVEGKSKTNDSTYSGRTRGNTIVVIPAREDLIGKIISPIIEKSGGYTLYGCVDNI